MAELLSSCSDDDNDRREKACDLSTRASAQAAAEEERNAPVYVSPFARKDGLAAAKEQRQQRRGAAAAVARNGSDSTEALDSSRRCQLTGRSAVKQLGRDAMASDDDDGWMSDAQAVDALKQQQRADQQRQQQQTKDTTAAEQTASDQRNALLLTRVESRSLKKRGHETLDSDSDETNDRWPRLPLPEHQLGPLTLLPAVPGGASARVSANINSYLFDYQRVGAQFLFSAYSRDTGAILGDEMGLGKTVQGDRHQQGELFGIRNLLCWNERGVLAGIQDAYRRSADGLVVQQNQVDYAKAAATAAAAKRNVAAAPTKRLAAGVPNGCDNEEMVDVADEIVTTIVATRAAPLPALTPRSQETAASADDDDDDDAQHALLNGARTLLHEAVVSKQPQVQQTETMAGNSGESTAAMAVSPVLPAARPSARHSRLRQTQLQPTPRKRIYIPKYL